MSPKSRGDRRGFFSKAFRADGCVADGHGVVVCGITKFTRRGKVFCGGHGYITLDENCEVIYKVTDCCTPGCDRGLACVG